MITAEQIRAARALLRLEQAQLAEKVGVSVQTIKRLEGQTGPVGANAQTIEAIQAALRREGVEFIDSSSEGGAGVRLAQDKQDKVRYQEERMISAVASLLAARLEKDPKFFERDVHQIAGDVTDDVLRCFNEIVMRHDLVMRGMGRHASATPVQNVRPSPESPLYGGPSLSPPHVLEQKRNQLGVAVEAVKPRRPTVIRVDRPKEKK